MSQFLHDNDDAKAIAIPQVFCGNSCAKTKSVFSTSSTMFSTISKGTMKLYSTTTLNLDDVKSLSTDIKTGLN